MVVLFVDLLLPLLEMLDDLFDAWAALRALLGHGEDQVVFNMLALLQWAVLAELPLLEQFLEQYIALMHRWHFVAELVQDQAQLIDVLRLVDLHVLELLRQGARVVVLLDLGSHVDLCARGRREERIDSREAQVPLFLHRW